MRIIETINKMIKPDPSKTTVVMLSAACCIPGMAGFDEQAKKIVEQAIIETGANAQLKVVAATTAMFGGGVSRKVMGELMTMFNQGKMVAPAILINGEVISYGVPTLDLMKETLNKLPKKNKNE